MTIQGFGVFLRKRAPALFNPIAMGDMAGKRLGIDMHHKVYQMFFRNGGDKDRVMDDLTNFCDRLDSHFMDTKFVFDGSTKGLKPKAHKDRKKAAERNKEKHAVVTEKLAAVKSACATAAIHAETPMDLEAVKLRLAIKARAAKDGATKDTLESQIEMVQARIDLEAKAVRTELYVKRPDNDLFSSVRTSLVDRYGPDGVVTAPDDAERWIAKEAADGNLDYAVSADYDTLVFGSPNLVIDFMHQEKMRVLFLPDVLGELGLSAAQFVDFAVLAGCDYCGKVPGIGVKRAHAFVVKHGSIEAGWAMLEKKLESDEDRAAFDYQFARDRFFHRDVVMPSKPKKETRRQNDNTGTSGTSGTSGGGCGEEVVVVAAAAPAAPAPPPVPTSPSASPAEPENNTPPDVVLPPSPVVLVARKGVAAEAEDKTQEKPEDDGVVVDDDDNTSIDDDGDSDTVSIDMAQWACGK